jgi:hypothetical protein
MLKKYHLFLNNKEILSAKSLKSLKENLAKDIKGYIIKIGLPKEKNKTTYSKLFSIYNYNKVRFIM